MNDVPTSTKKAVSGTGTDAPAAAAPSGRPVPPRTRQAAPPARPTEPPAGAASDAGAVLRRAAAPGRPGSWRTVRPAPSRIVGTGSAPRPEAVRPTASDAGAVLRRSPDPDRPGGWRGVLPAAPPPIVGTRARPEDGPSNAPIVGTDDDVFGASPPKAPVRRVPPAIVGTEGRPGAPGSAAMPTPTKLREPEARKPKGPSGPDDDLVRRLRAARKKQVADRARSRGRDPSAGSVPSVAGMSRSEDTHKQYIARGRSLVKRYRRETGLDQTSLDAIDPMEFTNWFFSLKPTLKPTAWRPYRQAAKAILATIPHEDAEAAIAMIDADVAERSERDVPAKAVPVPDDGTPRNRLPRRTSALKEKRMPKDDFDRIVSFLRHFSRSKLAPVLVDWMTAGVATGLRPAEWQATDVEVRADPSSVHGGRRVWLYVLNAKSTNGRANGIVRTLDLSGFGEKTLAAVRRMSERGAEWLLAGNYDSMQSQVAQLLYATCERLFAGKKVYSLYSMRHQFVANAKSYHRPESVSALLGHVVTDTAVSSYGKKRSSWEPDEIADRPEPVAEEVETVRQRILFYEERARLREAAGLDRPARGVPAEEGS